MGDVNMEKVESRDLCALCGGYCCKKCGCDYFVSDLENSKIEYFESLLDTGRVSVVAALNFKRLPNGKLFNEPLLYLRARNKNRDEIDLLSFKTIAFTEQKWWVLRVFPWVLPLFCR